MNLSVLMWGCCAVMRVVTEGGLAYSYNIDLE